MYNVNKIAVVCSISGREVWESRLEWKLELPYFGSCVCVAISGFEGFGFCGVSGFVWIGILWYVCLCI